MKILIAEDDRVNRTFLKEFMSVYGECDLAIDGVDALDYCMAAWKNNEPYDLLCLDVMMPKADGLKVLKVIRAIEAQQQIPVENRLRIMVMTALADVSYVDEAFKLGCDAYATKPIDTEKVNEVIQNLGFEPVKSSEL